MARTDAMVLGAGIVGISVALQLARRGMSVALVDRAGIGEATSYGNSGVIEGSTILPPAFPSSFSALLRVAFKRASEANYHLSFLPQVAPWLLAFRAASQPQRIAETARLNRPLFAAALPEHETLMAGGGRHALFAQDRLDEALSQRRCLRRPATRIRSGRGIRPAARTARCRGRAGAGAFAQSGLQARGVLAEGGVLEQSAGGDAAYAARFAALGGVTLAGDARSLHRAGNRWRVETNEGALDSAEAIVALGPWAPDLLEPLGIKLPMAVKRGYHRHFRGQGNAALSRPVVDVDFGYLITPMEQGIRLTTGAEFAARDAAPTPVQFDRLMPRARTLFPLGERADDVTWMGSRPCFPDSRPVIGRAPGQAGLWLAIGHAHWGLTLGPATGHLLADMIGGTTPFIDPAAFRAERFLS